jgi:hypothetical protein
MFFMIYATQIQLKGKRAGGIMIIQRLSRNMHGVSWLGILFLVAVVAIFIMARHFSSREKIQAKKNLSIMMNDPEMMIKQYLIEVSVNHEYKLDRWEKILDFMSVNDQRWFHGNFPLIASLNNRMGGVIAMAVTEREQKFGAMQVLTAFDRNRKDDRPLVSTIELNDPYGVVFVHMANRPETLTPIFIIREKHDWKVRRFGGSRDEPRIAHAIAEAKDSADHELTDDEKAVLKDPRKYVGVKRRELMAQCGIQEQ